MSRSRWPRLVQAVRGVRTPAVPPVAVLLPQPLRSEVVRLRDGGAEVDAVRMVRERTGLGLLPAVAAVQAAQETLTDPDPPLPP